MNLLAIEQFAFKSKALRLFLCSIAIIALLLFSLFAFIYINIRFEVAACERVADHLALDAKRALVVGDSANKVESFLNAHSIIFSYDKLQGRYQGQVRKIYKPSFFDGGVSVYVNLDPNDKYLSSEFHSSFTFL